MSAQENNRKPNIIYVLADDLGYGDLGCYGQEMIQTPNIDRMAKEGMRFSQHYAGSTVCAPSRCTFMTGQHTGHCFIRGNYNVSRDGYQGYKGEGNVPIPAVSVTIAERMKAAVYATGCIGKWGLGYPGSEGDPVKQGFDYFFGYNCQREAHSYYPDHLWRNQEKVQLNGKQYSHDLLAADALDFITNHKDKPFFLYLPFTIPHTKFEVPDLGPYGDNEWSENQKTHAAMITRMDSDIGKMMDLLKELGIEKDTLLIFTSDNGPHGSGGTLDFFDTNGPLRGRKRDLYEGGIRVPFIARWPQTIAAGSTSEHVSAFWDMLPTFCEIAGVPASAVTDGISFLPALTGRYQEQHDYLYWEFPVGGGQQAIRKGNFKALRKGVAKNVTPPVELYKLENDIAEQHDIAAQHPDIVREMQSLFESARTESKLFPLLPQ